jgi:hypothetical protein
MKTIITLLLLNFAFIACNNDRNEQPVQTTPPPPVVNPEPAKVTTKTQPDGTTIEMSNEGVKVESKQGDNKTDVNIQAGDSSHVIIKRK